MTKYNTLHGRWFCEKQKQVIINDQAPKFERGLVVWLDDHAKSPWFVVYVVFWDNGSKKWFPTNKYPSWLLPNADKKRV